MNIKKAIDAFCEMKDSNIIWIKIICNNCKEIDSMPVQECKSLHERLKGNVHCAYGCKEKTDLKIHSIKIYN